MHRARTGFTLDAEVEVVSLRHSATGRARDVTLERRGPGHWSAEVKHDDGSAFEATLRGAASVALPDATMYVAAGWIARTLPTGGWLMEAEA